MKEMNSELSKTFYSRFTSSGCSLHINCHSRKLPNRSQLLTPKELIFPLNSNLLTKKEQISRYLRNALDSLGARNKHKFSLCKPLDDPKLVNSPVLTKPSLPYNCLSPSPNNRRLRMEKSIKSLLCKIQLPGSTIEFRSLSEKKRYDRNKLELELLRERILTNPLQEVHIVWEFISRYMRNSTKEDAKTVVNLLKSNQIADIGESMQIVMLKALGRYQEKAPSTFLSYLNESQNIPRSKMKIGCRGTPPQQCENIKYSEIKSSIFRSKPLSPPTLSTFSGFLSTNMVPVVSGKKKFLEKYLQNKQKPIYYGSSKKLIRLLPKN